MLTQIGNVPMEQRDVEIAGRYFDVDAASIYLGITVRHVRELIYRREIPHYKVGRLVRFKPADLDAWMDRNRVESR